MSCILRLFQKRTMRRHSDSDQYSVVISLEGPLSNSLHELHILEECLAQRMSYLNRKSSLAFANASYAHQKGNMRKYITFINERRRYSEEIKKLGDRIQQVIEKENQIRYGPPVLLLPPTANPNLPTSPSQKFDAIVTVNPTQKLRNVPNHPSPQMVSSRPIGRPRSAIANTLPSPSPNLSLRP